MFDDLPFHSFLLLWAVFPATAIVVMVGFVQALLCNRAGALHFFAVGYAVYGFLDPVRSYVIFGETPEHNLEAVSTAIVLTGIAFVIVCVAYMWSASQIGGLIDRSARGGKVSPLVTGGTILAAFALLGVYHVAAPMELSGGKHYLGFLKHTVRAVALLCFYDGLQRNAKYLICVAGMLFYGSADDTSRRAYVTMFMPLVVLYVAHYHTRPDPHSATMSSIVGLRTKVLSALCVVFVFLNYLRSEHDFGAGFVEGNRRANTMSYISTLRSVAVFDNTAFVIDTFPRYYEYYYGSTFAAVPLGIVPRFVWPAKPYSMGAQLGVLRRLGERGFSEDTWILINRYSLSPGFVGEAYANAGGWGVVFYSACIGVVAALFDRRYGPWIRRCSPHGVAFVTWLPAFALLGRGDLYSAVIYALPIFVLTWVYIRFRMRTSALFVQ